MTESTPLHWPEGWVRTPAHKQERGYGVLCEGIDTWDMDPCKALLAACVEVNRKLKDQPTAPMGLKER